MTLQELRNWIIYYIENNKSKKNIDYEDSFNTLKELSKEIENIYKEEGLI